MSLNHPLVKVSLKYAAIATLLSVVTWLLVNYLIDVNVVSRSFLLLIIDVLYLGMFIFFSIKEFKDYRNHGELHFWQGMTIGIVLYLLVAVVSACIVYITYQYIDPSLFDKFLAQSIEMTEGQKDKIVKTIDLKAYEETISRLKETTTMDLALDTFMKKTIIGLFITIVISIILRK